MASHGLCCFLLHLPYLACTAFSSLNYSRYDLPPAFIFGAGTSAYQVEGAAFQDGRTPSIWGTFTHTGLANGATGDIACDEYHKYKEDVQLMVETGLGAYRFSISWSRLIPNGRGPVNPKGLAYYNNLINELISQGIQPHISLFHNDLPQALEDEYDGWISRRVVKTSHIMLMYASENSVILYWSTLNEGNVVAVLGYDVGKIPPHRCSTPFGNCPKGNSSTEPYIATHHMLLAHASVVQLYREKYQDTQQGFIGINVFAYWFVPMTNDPEDITATQRAFDFILGCFVDVLVFGDYPDTVKKRAGLRVPSFTEDELKQVKNSFDFMGINHYSTQYVKNNPEKLNMDHRDFNADMAPDMMFKQDDTPPDQFPITPWGPQKVLEYFKQVYGNPPVYIHENGQRTQRNASLNDTGRVKYLPGYIGGVLSAVRNGSNVRGYFMWSFLDVLELLDGYESSYGLYYVDLDDPDLKRYPKLSAHRYFGFLKGGNIISDRAIEIKKNKTPTSNVQSI